jgi:DNA primase
MTLLTLLQEFLGPSVQQKDEHLFACPFCAHAKKKLSINMVTYKWKCWVCNAKGMRLLSLLKRLNLPKKKFDQFKELLGEIRYHVSTQHDDAQIVHLPTEYKPLWKPEKTYTYLHALTYLHARGIDVEDILRYRIGYCDTGEYKHRIIIPSYDISGQLNYFTARSFYDSGLKYKNPPVSKNTIMFESMISWDEPIILCEGMFDAITLRQNAIPLMGKVLPKKLEWALLYHNVEQIIIFLDEDARADALKLEHKLKQYEIDVKVVLTKGKDASDLGFASAWEAIQTAHATDFKEFIKYRLFA